MRRSARRSVALLLALAALVTGPGPAVGVARTSAGEVVDGGATGSISGRVTGPAGADLSTVAVEANRADLSGGRGWTLAAADGSYTVEGLDPGAYRVSFSSPTLVRQMYRNAPTYDQATVVTVGTGPVTGIDAAMVLGATISGTIRTASDCDLTAVDVWAEGVPGVEIPDAVVEPDGRWAVHALPSGTYTIRFDGRYAGLAVRYWNATRDPLEGAPLTIATGETRTGIDVALDGPADGCVAYRPYVTRVYQDLLRRDPDPIGLTTWTNALAWGTPMNAVANSITWSDEYRGRLVDRAYQTYLGRSAEPEGRTFWLSQMRAGWQIGEIETGFLASDEFYLRQSGTEAGWVRGLYRTVLGREPSDAEAHGWEVQLLVGRSRFQVARGFLYSTEHLTAVVDGYYLELLDRHIDPTGRATWVDLIQRGRREEEVVAGIVSSVEYRARV